MGRACSGIEAKTECIWFPSTVPSSSLHYSVAFQATEWWRGPCSIHSVRESSSPSSSQGGRSFCECLTVKCYPVRVLYGIHLLLTVIPVRKSEATKFLRLTLVIETRGEEHLHIAMGVLLLLLSLLSFSGSVRLSAAQMPLFACDVAGNPALAGMGFCNGSLDVASRVQDLVGRLTLQEKIGNLVNTASAVSRLGIPAYEWWSEALHGVSNFGPNGTGTHFSSLVPGATSFPQPILTGASFNTTLFEAIGKVVSTEARAMHNVGLTGLTFWSPNVNIFRDPRWGRGQETPGEDPVLSSKYAASYVRGLQETDDPDKLKVAACCKHYTAYDVDNWKGIQRYTFSAVVSKQDLDDTFNVPFKSCVVDGNVASVMCSYNQVNGVPTCADPELLTGTIRGEWKLNGYIVTDCDSIYELYEHQHYTQTPEEAAAISIQAGVDLNCGFFLGQHTLAAIQAGKLTESDVNRAITNNFATLMRLRFFDGDPRKLPYGELGPSDVCTEPNRDLAREAARQGIVLLKNTGPTLPLSKSIKSLAVIGPNANVTHTMIGNYEGIPCKYTTPLQGLSAAVSTVYQPGCTDVSCFGNSLQLDAAKAAAAGADAVVLIAGADQSIEKESLDRESLYLPGQQPLLVTEITKAAKGPVILVIMSGGPFDISAAKADNKICGILWVGYPGEAGGEAIADVIFGDYNPSGRLPVTWYPQSYADKVPMTDMRMRPDPATGYPGRTYRFYTGDTVYAFGDGLSYSDFSHHLVQAPKKVSVPLDEGHECYTTKCKSVDLTGSTKCDRLAFDISMRVQHAGKMGGGHTVLLFSSPPAVHGAPVKQLLGFEKVHLEAGGTGNVVFRVDVCRDLSVTDELGIRKVALGSHVLHVGSLKHSLSVRV